MSPPSLVNAPPPPGSTAARRARAGLGLMVVGLLGWSSGACGSSPPPPAAGESMGTLPDLTGRAVMVLPVQDRAGLAASASDPDAELAFALQSLGPDVEWLPPEELREAVRASPALDVRLEGLPVSMFLRAEVERVGDPLFGILRRLGAVTGGEMALIPVQLRYRPGSATASGAVEVVAALLEIRTGYVLWFGVEDGVPGAPEEAGALASAMEALARRVSPGRAPVW